MELIRKGTMPVSEQKEEPQDSFFEEDDDISTDKEHLLPTGSTLLNLQLSDRWYGGYPIGRIISLVGESEAGKSLCALTCFAETSLYERFDRYRFILDPAEHGVMFDIKKMFGEEIARRIEILPDKDSSDTVEDFFSNFRKVLKKGEPFIYVLDSLDSLTCLAELARADEIEEKGEASASYQTEKARMISQLLRVTKKDIKTTEGLLILIHQTRDLIQTASKFKAKPVVESGIPGKTKGGGRAAKFYDSVEIWATGKPIIQTIRGMEKIVGTSAKLKVTKNRITGKKGKVNLIMNHYYGGIDDLTSCVEFLVETGAWKKEVNSIVPTMGLEKGMMPKIINQIETKCLEVEVQKLVGQVWQEIEEACKPNRKPRYS